MHDAFYSRKDKQLMALLLLLFRLTLDFMYIYIIQKEYNNINILSMGYANGAFSFHYDAGRIAYSFFASFLFIELLVRCIIRHDKPHELICVGLLGISILPNMVMFAYSNIEWRFILLLTIFWIWFYTIVILMNKKDEDIIDRGEQKSGSIGIFSKKTAWYLFWIIVLAFIFGSIVLSYRYYGGFHINLSFADNDVYELRLSARGSFGTFLNYFRNNAMYVIIPLIANIFLIKRKYGLFGISFIVLLLLFSVDSQKAVLMLAILSFGVAHIIKNKISNTLIRGLLFANLFVILFYLITGNLLLIEYLVKRIYFLPAIIGRCYYEYVTTNGNMVLLSSFLQGIGAIKNYVYADVSLPFLIGKYYFGSVSISANTGGFAGAYAYGILSLFITPLAYGFLFRLLDKVTILVEAKFYIPFIMVTVYVIVGSTISSVLLVYGYIIGIIMLYIMNNTDDFEFSKSSGI